MKITYKRGVMVTAALVAMLGCAGCDDASTRSNSAYARLNDPPRVVLVGGGKLEHIDFNWFGTGFKVVPFQNVTIPAPKLASYGASPRSSGLNDGTQTLDPDPDEHQMDPDLWPDPEEFPLPDPPLPMPDYPDEDPFDGLPEPPPFDPQDFETTNLSNGTFQDVSPAGPDFPPAPKLVPGQTSAATNDPSSKSTLVSVGATPTAFQNSPDGKFIYVSVSGGIAVVDRKTMAVVDRIKMPGEAIPYAMKITPDGTRLYVTSFVTAPAQVYVMDVAGKSVVTSFQVGAFPVGIELTPDGSQMWVTSFFDGSVVVIDTLSLTKTIAITGIPNAWAVRFNPTGTRAYVTSSTPTAGSVMVIDTATYTVINTIPVGDGPRSLAVTATGRHLFVANRNADTVSQIDAASGKVVRTITVGLKPEGFQFLP